MNEKLTNYLKRQIYNKNFSGCSYYILCDKQEYLNCIGKNNINSIINIGNFTNVLIINVLVSILINENEIKLNDRVVDYIPEFKYDDVLIIHLLTHSSGLVNRIDNKKFEAGTNVRINDINYKILKIIIEKLYTTDMELLARSLIFEPLAMNDTKLVKSQVYTTINDISHFAQMILNNGYYNGKLFIDIKYIDTWFTPLYMGDNGIRTTVGWLFAPSSDLCKNIDFSLSTICYGNKSYILIDRDNELAIVLLFNNLSIDKRCNINKYIYKLLKEYGKIY